MSGEFEAGSDITTGVLTARAVEPGHGESTDNGHGGECLNCGAPTRGNFCSSCGQATHVHRSFAAIGHDLMHGVLHIEGKIWHTLPELFFRPGKLGRRYINGERAKFVSPLALFLFSAFLMYAVYSLTSSSAEKTAEDAATEAVFDPAAGRDEALGEIDDQIEELDAEIAQIQTQLDAPDLSGEERAELELQLETQTAARDEVNRVGAIQRTLAGDADNPIASIIGKARENPDLVYYKLKANAYKYSWMLILISLPFVWLLFPFSRKFKMYDHAVYVTYSITFMSFLFSVIMVVGVLPAEYEIISITLFFYAAWHMYRQLKDTYALSRPGTLVRLPFLYMFSAISLLIFFAILTLM